MGSDGTDATAAAPQQSQTQIGALLRLLLKQQFRKLHREKNKQIKHVDYKGKVKQAHSKQKKSRVE